MISPLDKNISINRNKIAAKEYHRNPLFISKWFSLNDENVRWRGQQQLSFSRLIGCETPTLENLKILDVGCGTGFWLRWIKEWGAQTENIVGLDISHLRIENAIKIDKTIRFIIGSAFELPFPDMHFDLVMQWVCFSSIEGEHNRKFAAHEMMRVVRPNGRIFWWDSQNSVIPNETSVGIEPQKYFNDCTIDSIDISINLRPSECIYGRFVFYRWIGLLLDKIFYRPTHIASVIKNNIL